MTRMHIVCVKPPKSPIPDAKAVNAAIDQVYELAADGAKALYEKTVRTWKHPSAFTIQHGNRTWTIRTKDPIYNYVDMGTKPHIIRARRAPMLRFMAGGFRPKTKPSYLSSYTGHGANKIAVSVRQVKHPGTKARGFSEMIGERISRRILSEMNIEFRRLAEE